VIIKDLRFADDVDLLAEEEVDQLHTNSKEYGLQINTNKSKVMVFERRSYRHPTITFDTGVLECVPEFVYLGSLVTKDNDCSAEIDLLVACVFSHLLYAAETWTINAADSRKLLVFEMRCGNSTARDRVCSHCTIVDVVKQKKLQLFGHICRMNDQRLVKIVMLGVVEGN